jgi:hypothetical protein
VAPGDLISYPLRKRTQQTNRYNNVFSCPELCKNESTNGGEMADEKDKSPKRKLDEFVGESYFAEEKKVGDLAENEDLVRGFAQLEEKEREITETPWVVEQLADTYFSQTD